MSTPTVAAGGYLVLKPVTTMHGQIKGMKIDRVTQTYPQRLADGERAVPITVMVPKSVFQLMALLLFVIAGIASAVGMFMITPMTAGWLACGIAFGVLWDMILQALIFLGMDTYGEAIIWFANPAFCSWDTAWLRLLAVD